MSAAWPLTGREEELRFIERALRRTEGPRGVVLAGAAGVGKTRLAREALAVAARRGATTRWVPATASARVLPLGAFTGVLNVTGQDQSRVVQRATSALVDGAGSAGVVVAVDDAHLLDDLSSLLVQQIVVRRAATVILTLRSGEPAPDAVTGLWKDGYLDRCEVQPLSEDETAELLEAVLGGPVDSATAARLSALARGSALYLRQLVESGVESTRLRQVGGVWRWEGPSLMSQSLSELVEDRMGNLSEPVREVVDVLAFGEPLPVSLLAGVTDPVAVEQAEARGLVSVDGDDGPLRARLAHPLYGEVRRMRTGPLRAARVCRRLAQALGEAGDNGGTDILRRAVLTLEADAAMGAEGQVDPELFTTAAQRALELCDAALAAKLADAAVRAGGGYGPHFLLVYALCLNDQGEDGEREAAALALGASTDEQRVQVAQLRAGNLFWKLGRPDQAESTLDAVDALAKTIGAGPELDALRAPISAELGRTADAIRAATDALASPSLSDNSVVLATWGLTLGLGVVGRVDEIGPVIERAAAAATRTAEGRLLLQPVKFYQINALRLGGYLDEAEDIACAERNDTWEVPGIGPPVTLFLVGHTALGRGKLRSARRWLREAFAGLGACNQRTWAVLSQLYLTQAVAMSGDAVAAERELSALDAVIREYRASNTLHVVQPEIILARAWVVAAQGAVSEAVVLAHEAADIARAAGQLAHEVFALHTAVCFGDRTVAQRLTELAAVVDGPRAPAAAAQADALAADDGHALLEVSDRLERMGDLLAAADAAAQATVAHTRHGLRGSANTAGARAHRLAKDSEDARTPALALAARPLPLTARQREIGTLVAQGLSNQQIADRLTMSVRTVEGHIYRAGTKLGFTNRAEFAALVRDEVPGD
ncbi:helix-turn-helix transcriptional regulator [Rhodococcus sp. ACS1]|uniref:helix-turn-helix transcriptional regulator n=1 Tax=Rhodococcus sp. ACS1 TaxID=2028570 RepID=UPI000BB15B40|nr:LuxR C-terminal-related transcriptional regulator [Rhodococcus sp. ACS1]PBC35511.1 helix-turn-helix transcriptional regulator [Rhodococcus sp. ACS1]